MLGINLRLEIRSKIPSVTCPVIQRFDRRKRIIWSDIVRWPAVICSPGLDPPLQVSPYSRTGKLTSGADLVRFVWGVQVFQRGSGGILSQKMFEIWSPEMPFPAFWALRLFVKFVLTVLVFRAKIKKSATLHGDPPYWCLNIFSRIRKSIVSI